nr:aminopeptidase O-like isoform X1 [Odocoileus virginianus texanus]
MSLFKSEDRGMGSRGSELCKLVKLLQPGCGGQSGCNNPSSYSSAGLMKGLGETLEISGEERGASWATGLRWLVNLLLPDQLVLLLEHLLEQKTVTPRTLQSLERTYHLSEQDAEVRHRWCELIVKHKYTKAYRDVERFLQEDQAMGIYLYGELMLSEDPRQQHLARRCFELSREQMDRSSAEVVAEMLF